MSFYFRRLYATLPKAPEAASPTAARALSSPLQVRRRRLRKQLSAPEGSSSTLLPNEQARYHRLKRSGALLKEENGFREPTEEEWFSELNERRTRIRGAVQHEVEDPETGEIRTVDDVVGHRIYLPNIVFRMMRNYTPPGQPYNPWEATFRIPNSVTKLDVRSYLHAVYGVQCTYIRTDNYFSPMFRSKIKGFRQNLATEKKRRAYKRAVVGLVEPFYYPEALEDMDLVERQTREKWMDENFHLQAQRDIIRETAMKTWHGIGYKKFNISGSRGAILRSVLARRDERERAVDEGAQTFLKSNHAPTTEV